MNCGELLKRRDFQAVFSVTGNNSLGSQYEYIDETAQSGTLYYRLKQIDLDGTFQWSPLVQVSFKKTLHQQIEVKSLGGASWEVLVTPKADEDMQWQIIDPKGQLLQKGKLLSGHSTLSINTKAPAFYFVLFSKNGIFKQLIVTP